MKRVILFSVLFCMVLGLSLDVQALTTTQTLNGVTNPQWFIPDGYDPYPGDGDYFRGWPAVDLYHRAYNEDWGWTHTVNFNPIGPITVTGATLTIVAWDVDVTGGNANLNDTMPNEIDVIKVGTSNGSGGVSLGNLTGSSGNWSTTTFTLDAAALAQLTVVADTTGTLKVWIDISSLENTNGYTYDWWYVTLKSATLSVDYIPAPGAIILGSLGAGIVGWLRRRRTL